MQLNRGVGILTNSERKLEVLLHLSQVLGQEIHLDRMLRIMVSEVTQAMGAERTSLFLYDEPKRELFTKVAEGMQEKEIRIALGVGIAGAAAATRQSINIRNAYGDSRFDPTVDKHSGFVTRSLLSMPILSNKNRLLGVVQVLNKLNNEVFTDEDEEFLRGICTHLALTLERAELVEDHVQSQKLQESLRLAHDLQMSLVPQHFPALPDKPEIDIYGTLKPALDVGGDLYDFFLLDDDHLCFVIGDVSDKGVHAALFMAITRSAFKISARAHQENWIEVILDVVNRFLCENNDSQMFVTMFGGILDLRTGHITYADGGHEPPFVVRRGGKAEMVDKKGGLALAVMEDYVFQAGDIQLEPGDALVLYTDGINEAMNVQRQLFKDSRIQATLESLCDGESAEIIVKTLMKNLSEFVGDAPQSDDITILVLRYMGTMGTQRLKA
jgi:serine phosphatase RsbU (regulator of sigma subunit)